MPHRLTPVAGEWRSDVIAPRGWDLGLFGLVKGKFRSPNPGQKQSDERHTQMKIQRENPVFCGISAQNHTCAAAGQHF